MNILLTGATGFLGSHIAEELLKQGHKVYATCRNTSVFNKCASFKDSIIWLNQDVDNWETGMSNVQLDLFIHSAWAGISAMDRDNWDIQLANFHYSKLMIEFASTLNVKKIICLGSQAEYGYFSSKVTENHVPYPTDSYGATKLLTLHYLRNKAAQCSFEWYWLRVFSVIGKNENSNWLLPQVMNKLMSGTEIELTEGRQCYDYLYMDDFICRLNKVLNCSSDLSGIYNICSGRPVEIQALLLLVAKQLNVSSSLLKFGAIPYRINQNMYIVGSPEKFESKFGMTPVESIEETVRKITYFHKNSSK